MEGRGNDIARLRIGPNRQSLERGPDDLLRDRRIAVDGNKTDDPVLCIVFGEGLRERGPIRRRAALIDEAIAAVETTKQTWFEADIHRIVGEIALMSPAPDAAKAQTYFERALEISRAQQARSWELRAAMSLARLRRDQGRRAEAHDLLAPVYGWFTEGFDTLDLKEAKALLAELAS